MPDLTLRLTDDQHAGLVREATVLQFDSPDALALRLVTDAAHRGMATLRAEQDAAFNAKRFVYEKADPKMTKEQIEAACAAAVSAAAQVETPVEDIKG